MSDPVIDEHPVTDHGWPEGCRAAISVTFDDARWSQVAQGIPILDRYGVRGTFYVLPSGLELQPDEWRQAAASGHELGNHTLRHPCSGNFKWARARALEDYTLEQMAAELDEATLMVNDLAGVEPRTYAYTCGQKFVGRGAGTRSYVPLVAERFLAGRGFRDESVNDPAFSDLAQAAGVDFDCLSFDACRTWIERAVDEGGWLVFAGHDVGAGERQTVWPETLESICAYCSDRQNGLWIDTVAAIATHLVKWRSRPRA